MILFCDAFGLQYGFFQFQICGELLIEMLIKERIRDDILVMEVGAELL